MRMVDITEGMPPIDVLKESIKDDDAILVRDGHVVMLIRAFDDEDWADWQIEHDAELREKTRLAQSEMERGNYVSLDDLDRELEEE